MRTSTISLIAIAGLTRLATAVGNAIVTNNCASPVYIWSVDSTVGPEQTLNKGESYSEQLHTDPKTGGVSIKITLGSNGLYDGSAQTDFAYTLSGDQVWYDLSDVFGDAFSGSSVTVTPSDTACESISWSNGVPPAGSQVHVCESDTDLTLTLC